MKFKNNYLFLLIALFFATYSPAQIMRETVKSRLDDYFMSYHENNNRVESCDVDSFKIDDYQRELFIYPSQCFAEQSFTEEKIKRIEDQLRHILPPALHKFKFHILVNNTNIKQLVPNFYRKELKWDKKRLQQTQHKQTPWVRNISRPYKANKGLEGKHLTICPSHGYYFNVEKGQWETQRPSLFCTHEGLYTLSLATSYLIPMLENAGAIVYSTRERDTQRNEVVVDNNPSHKTRSIYVEQNSKKSQWFTMKDGKGYDQPTKQLKNGVNRFKQGDFRFTRTEKKADKAYAGWIPNIPETGEYAVYVTYPEWPENVSDAQYIVLHQGGSTIFKVNQKIGGGTWVYLGTFKFQKGCKNKNMVLLSNQSNEKGVVCADAVRFGGGYGDIVRAKTDNDSLQSSGMPRFMESARYAAQYYGMPATLYNSKKGTNDYIDDIMTRSLTSNYLCGGTKYNPRETGLKVPMELKLSLHTDLGYTKKNKVIGSLGTYYSNLPTGRLANGTLQLASRDLADIMLKELKKDLSQGFLLEWHLRKIQNREYSETKLSAIPAVILELLSYENFKDMQLAHHPIFKFKAARAIYKAIVKFLATQHREKYVIQPLPVDHFQIERDEKDKNAVVLRWLPVLDSQEATAQPNRYIVYTRIGEAGFDNGTLTHDTSCKIQIHPGFIYSFKVAAVNEGGESFASETLSAYIAPQSRSNQRTVMIVNGFDRLSAPQIVDTDSLAGFDLQQSPGIPYQATFSYCGSQINFNRFSKRNTFKNTLGYSNNNLMNIKIMGNTFDYPYIHGKAIQEAGQYSFVSCSDESVEHQKVDLNAYYMVDYILGMEHECKTDPELARVAPYKTFSENMQRALTNYCYQGGNLLVSGAFVGRDMQKKASDQRFTKEVLKYAYEKTIQQTFSGEIEGLNRKFTVSQGINEERYAVSSVDCIAPLGGAFSVFAYDENRFSGGIAYAGTDYGTFILGFPFESIQDINNRTYLMMGILDFFNSRKHSP